VTDAEIERLLPEFEGLVFETARQIVVGGVELDFDDVRQLLRIKVWRAIVAFDARRAGTMPLKRFVFGCVVNLRKDLEKRPRRYIDSIERIRERSLDACEGEPSDWFDLRYLSIDAEQVYGRVEDELRLPSTLDRAERALVAMTMQGRPAQEVEAELGLSCAQRKQAMREVREKLADWQPPRRAPTRPLPDAEPRRAAARVPLAA
jgi:DNA-directed RNA polymerase specialized sigma24 family protein